MNKMNNKNIINYPFNFFEKLNNIPLNHVCPCSVMIQNTEVGGIIITCNSQDLKYFNIVPNAPIQPSLKFRMIDFNKLIYVIEIWMLFGKKSDKILKMHLNPYNLNVKKLFQLTLNTKMLSFHFINTDSELFVSGFKSLDDEELPWFERNYKLIAKLKSQKKLYTLLSEKFAQETSKSDKIFKYFECKKKRIFYTKWSNSSNELKVGNLTHFKITR